MNQNIKQILRELYMIDPELKNNEKEITEIINEMLKNKPDISLDDNFTKSLREKIMKKSSQQKINFWKKINFSQFALPAFGTLALLILAFIIPKEVAKFNETKNYGLGFQNKITEIENQAFGSLTSASVNGENIQDSRATQEETFGVGGGGMITTPTTNLAVGEKMVVSMPYQPINYEYQYIGEDFTIPEELLVYKKEKSQNVGANLSQVLSGFDFNLIGINKFNESQIDSFVLSENREFGYTVYFNLLDNMVNINSNWRTWPQVGRECEDNSCWKKYNLTTSDMPSDEELVKIADDFVKKYGIDMGSYGSGRVSEAQRFYALSIEEESYIPEIINVLYPLKIKDSYVYETSGESSGLNISINIRYKKVSDVNNIMPANYLASKYDIETDKNKLISRAEKGGFYPTWKNENAQKTIIIKLGDPEIGLVKYYQYDSEKNESNELYLPALIFPITNAGEDNSIYQKNITVPLVKEILEENNNEQPVLLERTTPGAEPMLY